MMIFGGLGKLESHFFVPEAYKGLNRNIVTDKFEFKHLLPNNVKNLDYTWNILYHVKRPGIILAGSSQVNKTLMIHIDMNYPERNGTAEIEAPPIKFLGLEDEKLLILYKNLPKRTLYRVMFNFTL